jgi:hypothetical protein
MTDKKHQMYINQVSKNLMAWSDLTTLCLELRKSFLKTKHASMDDTALIKKIFSEVVANKENNWTSKRHS